MNDIDCECVGSEFICNTCKSTALTRYIERFPRIDFSTYFVFPSSAAEQDHIERYGSFSLEGKVFGFCFQLGYLLGRLSHPTQCDHTRTDDDLFEYELFSSERQKAANDFLLAKEAAAMRQRIGYWPVDPVEVQRWMYQVGPDG